MYDLVLNLSFRGAGVNIEIERDTLDKLDTMVTNVKAVRLKTSTTNRQTKPGKENRSVKS